MSRWELFRDTVVFQVKLSLDAVRDIVLSPVSITCAVIDLIKGHDTEQSYFHKLMSMGHQSDTWLNLFGTRKSTHHKDNLSSDDSAPNSQKPVNVDNLFDQVEALLKHQHSKGGLTATAKANIDNYLDKIISSSLASKTLESSALQSESTDKNTETKK